jgi:hypothetical protein
VTLGGWKKIPSLVRVEWLDSNSRHGWARVTDEQEDKVDMRCVSVGFLFAKEKGYVKLAQSLSATNFVDTVLTIPRCAITRLDVLPEPVVP